MKVRPVLLAALVVASSWVAGESVVVLGRASQHASAWWGCVEAGAYASGVARWLSPVVHGLWIAVKS